MISLFQIFDSEACYVDELNVVLMDQIPLFCIYLMKV